MSEVLSVLYYTVPCQVQSWFYIIRFHIKSPVRLILFDSMSEVQFWFYIIWFYVKSPVLVLYYMVLCQKSSHCFILYGSMSKVQSWFYNIRFQVKYPVLVLYYMVPCQKSSTGFPIVPPVVLLLNHTNIIQHGNRVGHQHTLINTENINKPWTLYILNGSKDEPNIVSIQKYADPPTTYEWTQVLAKDKQLLPLIRHPPC